MKNKVLIGSLAALLVLGGAIAVGASKNDSRTDDSIHPDDKNTTVDVGSQQLPEITAGQEIELETEHGETFYKVEDNGSNSSTSSSQSNISTLTTEEAAKIATDKVNGTITKIEKEMEHGRLEYKFEIQSDRGEVDVRVDAETGKITRIDYDDDSFEDNDDDQSDDGEKNDDKGFGNDDKRDQ